MRMIQEQKLEQQLILTHEMKQSLEVLQLPVIELKELIEREIQENPLLESDNLNNLEKKGRDDKEDISSSSYEDYYKHSGNYQDIKGSSSYRDESTANIIERIVEQEDSVIDLIIKEVRTLLNNEDEYLILEYIIGNLDNSGYLKLSVEDIQASILNDTGKKFRMSLIDEIRKTLMDIEPFGVGSLDLPEFLVYKISLEELDESHEIAIEILENFFEEFSRKKIRDLVKKIGVSERKIKKAYEIISNYNPYPLRGYLGEKREQVIIPEIIVKEEYGGFEVYLNDEYIPRIRLNNEYLDVLSKDKEAVSYLKEIAQKGKNLKKNIEHRNLTLYRVAKTIVEKQKDFFQRGEKYLVPLTLAEIAEMLDFHESTISRVISGKYMETPRGVFELKFFFSGKVETKNGKNLSILAVQEMIKEIIDSEKRVKPFTDKEIASVLISRGLKISQRTVTNYREAMKILPTYLRKEI